jgi:hypothetical protein
MPRAAFGACPLPLSRLGQMQADLTYRKARSIQTMPLDKTKTAFQIATDQNSAVTA